MTDQRPTRTPYTPTHDEWTSVWDMLCGHCIKALGCGTCEAMIEHVAGGPWPDGGWTTDPGGGVTCLSYAAAGTQRRLSRQQVRRLSRMSDELMPPVCGGCAATNGTEASRCLHTQRDFASAVKHRSVFNCHERPGYCGGWVRAMIARMPRK